MPRKKQGLIDDLVDVTSILPWWVGILLAIASYILMRWLVSPEPVASASRASAAISGSTITSSLFLVGQWLLPAVFAIGAVISGSRSLRHRREAQRELREPTQRHNDDRNTSYAPKEIDPDLYKDWKEATEPQPQDPPVATDRWSLELLKRLEWKRFEILCSTYFDALGFRAHRTHKGADGGVDIRLFAAGSTTPGILVQCKAWRERSVGVAVARELFGVMASEAIAEGILITTSTFTPDAVEFAKGKNVHLVDGVKFLEMLLALDQDRQSAMLQMATEGDYTTPTCPSCGDGVRMRLRVSGKDRTRFWGCSRFPVCRTTMRWSQGSPRS